MHDAWRQARPDCLFEQPHLGINYFQTTDEAKGFIVDEAREGRPRTYLYEASFRNAAWTITLSTADPRNGNSFRDRDGAGNPIRSISGMRVGERKDLRIRLQSYLVKFRAKVLKSEDELRRRALQGLKIEFDGDRASYFLSEKTLIRIQRTTIREFVRAIDLPDASLDAAKRFLG